MNVKITNGLHRGNIINGTFEVVKPWQSSATGGFITVKAEVNNIFQTRSPRIKVEQSDAVLVDDNGNELGEQCNIVVNKQGQLTTETDYEQAFMSSETDEAAMERMHASFLMLDKITNACAKNTIRGLVVSGPPGIGKSFGVSKQLEMVNLCRTSNGLEPNYEILSGGVSSIGLYQKLYFNRSKEHVLVFDDADEIFSNEECLNLLKAALNSEESRKICWNKESRVLSMLDIPESFYFEASIIFLSNIDFESSIARGSRISAHLAALMSRCHYLDLRIGSTRDKLLRIKQVVRDGMLSSYQFNTLEEAAIIDFVVSNAEYMREISLRAVKKLADLVKIDPTNWYDAAEATLLHKDAFFKRLLDKQKCAASNNVSMFGEAVF